LKTDLENAELRKLKYETSKRERKKSWDSRKERGVGGRRGVVGGCNDRKPPQKGTQGIQRTKKPKKKVGKKILGNFGEA